MPTIGKTSEKRRYSRQGTKVEAVMAIGDSTPIQCVILDFCEQGLFLQIKQPLSVGLKKGKSAKIYFSSHTGTTKEYFQIDAQIARVSDDGIGVSFENISDSMFSALKESTNIGSIAAYSKNPKLYLTSTNQEHFKKAFKDFLNNNIPLLMNEFFGNAEDELEKKPEFAENFKDISAHANLYSLLMLNKVNLTVGFCQAVTADLDFTGEKIESNPSSNQQGSNLSLVEKETFEDWLSFSTLIRKVNANFKNQLYQLELKLSYVTCFPRYLIRNPIAPEQLCETFRSEITKLEDSNAARKILYKAFEKTLNDYLPGLYNAFDALLVEHGAPKEKAEDIVWKKNYPTNANQNVPSGFASGKPLPSFDSDEYYYPDPSEKNSQAVAPPLSSQYRPPISRTATKLFSLLNQSLAPGQARITDFGQNRTNAHSEIYRGSEYSIDELLSALTKLQASNAAQQLPRDTSSLLQAQLDEAMASTGYFGGKTFSQADKTKLDVYDQLFQALLNEVVLTPNIKSYLESIRLPLMALTLQDPNFLDNDSHPARHLLNQLFSLDSAVNQNKVIKNTQITQVLDQLVSKISKGSITNPDIFAKANEELKEISVPIARSREANIRRVIEIYEGKQKLEKARLNVQREIDIRIGGKTIPAIIKSLLDSGWQHLLVMSELNGDGINRQRYLEIIDELLAWCNNLKDFPNDQLNIIEMELDYVDNTLGSVCPNVFVHNKIVEELKATLLGTGMPRTRKPLDMVITELKSRESAHEFVSDRWFLEVDQLKIGDWFTFSLEKESFEPLKLVWIGELPQVYVFVNRDGYKKQELTRNELAELLQSGIATQIENLDEPLMDRATTTMLQHMQEKLIHSVSHDPVTNLPNRKRFIALLKEHVSRFDSSKYVLGYLEIEDFRIITNVCGLLGGDQLLSQIAQLLSKLLVKDGLVSRLGDKTFGFLLTNCIPEKGYEIAKNIRDVINKSNFVWDDKSYTIGVSIGLVPIAENTLHVEELLQKADTVNISAKRSGHNRIRVYQENDETLRVQTDIHEWAGRIDRIFSENRLFARCQMISPINPEKNSHSHYEILLGVRDEVGNIIPPDNFIPAVERCQRMPEIDQWIVENVFGWIIQNRKRFEKIGGFAINLSGQSLNSEEFLGFLKERLSAQDIPPEKITFEVTETVAAGSLIFTKRFIKEIKQFGCKFSLDDFGTGYSSYSYLKSLDVDYLKIDGAFIKDITNSPTDVVMVNSMNEIAHSLELETIAEYVENMKIHAILKEIGVDYAQGWGIQKPIPLANLLATLNE